MKPDINNSLPELLLALRRKINKEIKEKNKLNHELTVAQLEVLWLLESSGEKNMESIAEYFGIKPPLHHQHDRQDAQAGVC